MSTKSVGLTLLRFISLRFSCSDVVVVYVNCAVLIKGCKSLQDLMLGFTKVFRFSK
jgi:hypothetical protein